MALLDKVEKRLGSNVSPWLSLLLFLLKSRTIVYGFGIAAIGTFLLSSGTKMPDFFTMGRLFGSVYLLALATYLYNDLTDYKIDQINNRSTTNKSKNYRYDRQLHSIMGFFLVSTILAFSINPITGLFSLIAIALAFAYSHQSIHLKDRFIIKTITTAGGGVIASMMGAFAADGISYITLASSSIVFLLYFINGPLNDIRDLVGDKEGGRKTIPIVIGVKNSFHLINAVILSIGIIVMLVFYFLGIHPIGLVLGLIVCTYLAVRINKLYKFYQDKIKMNSVRATVRNSIFYLQMSLFIGLILSLPNLN